MEKIVQCQLYDTIFKNYSFLLQTLTKLLRSQLAFGFPECHTTFQILAHICAPYSS